MLTSVPYFCICCSSYRCSSWPVLTFLPLSASFLQVLTALDALHLIGIVHNDLKLDNIMLVNHEMQPYKVKLIDFGMAFKTSEAELYQGVEMQVLIQR